VVDENVDENEISGKDSAESKVWKKMRELKNLVKAITT
jgi:hypothetical protein